MAEAAVTWILEEIGVEFASWVAAAVVETAAYVAVAASVYTLREQQRRAKNAYNNGLADRYVMQRATTAQRSMVLGRVRVSGPITFLHSYGDNNTTLALCVVLAAHECDAIEEIYFNDTALILDGGGNVVGTKIVEHFSISGTTATFTLGSVGVAGTASAVATYDTGDVSLGVVMSGDGRTLSITGGTAGKVGSVVVTYQPYEVVYTPTRIQDSHQQQTASGSTGTFTVPSNCITASAVVVDIAASGAQTVIGFSRAGNVITYTGATSGHTVHLMYQAGTTYSRARITKHLGAPGQAADASLISALPDLWTSAHRGDGLCYLKVELDYDPSTFPSGIPNISAVVRGLKCYDPRTSTTAWTDNPALLMRAYYLHPLGAGRSSGEINDASVIAAANVCDGTVTYTVGTHKQTRARYKASTLATKDRRPQDVLTDLAHAMGGRWVVSGNQLVVKAGAFTSPVASIDATWLHTGSGVSVQPRPNRADLTNSIVGSFADEEQAWQTVAFPKVSAAAYITADGAELQARIDYPAVTYSGQAQYLSACAIRYNRSGLTVRLSCNLRAFPLEVFDVVSVTLARFGWTAKTFEVIATGFSVEGLVELTLKEIDSSIWTLDSAYSATDYAIKTALPSPWVLPVPAMGTPVSGTSYLLRQADGSIVSRIYVPVTASTDTAVLQGGFLDVSYRRFGDVNDDWATVSVPGDSTGAFLAGVNDGAVYVIKARWRNKLAEGNWSQQVVHQVVGKTAAPAAVSGFALTVVPGALRGSRTPSTEADYDHTVYRYGASFAAGTAVPGTTDASGFVWPWPALGSYTVWAADVDTTGNVGTPVSATVTVDSRLLIGPSNTNGSNNLIDVGWWKQDATIPWSPNGEYNRLVNTAPAGGADLNVPGPRGNDDCVWYSQEVTGDSNAGGGWDANNSLQLDPTRTYRFVVPVRLMDTTSGTAYWGVQGSTVCDNNTTTPNSNPYFAAINHIGSSSDRWYLLVGYLFPAGSTGHSNESSGVWDCKTGAKVGTGFNYCHRAATGGLTGHRAYQFYVVTGERQLFGRPMVNLVDGTEPSLREYFEAGAVLNSALVPSISAAQYAADAAQGTANGAATNASSALSTLATMRSNGYLDASEKPAVIKAWQAIADEYAGIYNQGTAYGLITLRTAYYTGYSNLQSYLSGLSPSWSDTTVDTPITPATDQATWAAYYSSRQALLNAIADEAAKRADWAQVGGSGKPLDNAGKTVDLGGATGVFGARNRDDLPSEYPWGRSQQFKQASAIGLSSGDGTYCTLETIIQYTDDSGGPNVQYAYQGTKTWRRSALRSASSWGAWTQDLDRNVYTGDLAATKNILTRSTSAPSSPSDGDFWIDTSVTPNTIRVRLGGVWQVAGTYVNGTAQIVDDANLGLTALWSGVAGTGRPVDSATRSIVTQDNYAFGGGGVSSVPTVQRSFTVTPAFACTISFSAIIGASGVNPDSASYLSWAVSVGGGADTALGACPGGSARQTFSCLAQFSASAGVALTFKLISDRASGNPAMNLYDSAMRVEQVIAP